MFDELPYGYEEFFKQNPQFADTSFLKYLFKIFQIEVSTKEYRPYWNNDKNNQLQIIFTGKPIYVSTAGYGYKNPSDVILKNYKFKNLTKKQLKEYEEFYKINQAKYGNYYLYKKGELSQFLDQFKLKRYAFAYNPYVELITLHKQALGRNWLINYFKNGWYRKNIEYERIYNTDLMKGYAGWKVDIRWQPKETIQEGEQRFITLVPTVYVSFIKSSTKARFMDWMGISAGYGGSNMMLGEVLNPSQQVPFMNWEIESPWREKG